MVGQNKSKTNSPLPNKTHFSQDYPTDRILGQDLFKNKTPINVDRLEWELIGHPNQNLAAKSCKELRSGARVGYDGPRTPKWSRNLPTAFENPKIVSENLAKEVQFGRVAGPFDKPPFPNLQVSPIGIVPKKHSDKFRTIFHLSYPKSGESINSGIDKEEAYSLNYVTVDSAIEALQSFGRGTFMAKTDVESAFRIFPVDPRDWELLGMHWEGKYYFEKFLPFGLRSSPFLFNQLAECIEWILKEKCAISYVAHFLDDFLILEPPSDGPTPDFACKTSLRSMLLAFKHLGVPLAANKTQGPFTRLEFLGIVLDSDLTEASLPEDKEPLPADIFQL